MMASTSASAYIQWESLKDHQLTTDHVHQILESIPDDLWVVTACLDRVVDDFPVQQALLLLGISKTDSVIERCKDVLAFASQGQLDNIPSQLTHDTLLTHFQTIATDADLCYIRSILLQRLDRLNTYILAEKEFAEEWGSGEDDDMEEWEDDPWADNPTPSSSAAQAKHISKHPVLLSDFLLNDLVRSACEFASSQYFGALRVIFQKHASALWPYRFTVLESIPEYVSPSLYRNLLPSFNTLTNAEPLPLDDRWRNEQDVSEWPETQLAIRLSASLRHTALECRVAPSSMPVFPPLSPEELSAWYKRRVTDATMATGMIDVALEIIQHGASQGIPGLDELGEELSLLSRLVYDAPQGTGIPDDWTLSRWYDMDPPTIVQAYLSHSTPDSLPRDISRLVMPYLFILESRAERAGTPDPGLSSRLLYEYILSLPLEMAAAVFEASKPTLAVTQRLIRDDEDVARVALACLYGSHSLDQWSTMSRIFECLPAWDSASGDTAEDAADTTVASLSAFLTPTTGHPRCKPNELLLFFKPLTSVSLSRALDILDVHLESGEILSRWSVPAPLWWFLQSYENADEQRAWANRMARRAGGVGDQLDTKEDWEWLLEDMLKLTEKSEAGLKEAFGLLSQAEVTSIFFGGLLSTGKFTIAKALLNDPHSKLSQIADKIEDLCLATYRELYDNASSGNYKFGDMKLAYDCLNVPPPSDRLHREKEFIEATSRICSFNVTSRQGIPISPIEIRLTKDRLSLVSQVLSSNIDAYKHTEVILDLCYKLGFRGDAAAEVKALAMLADAAFQAEDVSRAYENSKRMIDVVSKLRSFAVSGSDDATIADATEVCWIACFQLGRQPEFDDLEKKSLLLGHALEFCPPEKLHDVLTAWRTIHKEDIAAREERLVHERSSTMASVPSKGHEDSMPTVASSLRARLQDLHMPTPPLLSTPDATALASRTFRSVAANFPFSVGHHGRTHDSDMDDSASHDGSSRRVEGDNVSSQATRALSKGIGWLIGADDL